MNRFRAIHSLLDGGGMSTKTAPERVIEFEQASFIAALARRVARKEKG